MKILVDWDLCQGHGTCVTEAAEVFQLNSKGDLEVLQESPPEELRAKVKAAVRLCPSYALSLLED